MNFKPLLASFLPEIIIQSRKVYVQEKKISNILGLISLGHPDKRDKWYNTSNATSKIYRDCENRTVFKDVRL